MYERLNAFANRLPLFSRGQRRCQSTYSEPAGSVLQSEMWPDLKPFMNQCLRCSEVPCVKPALHVFLFATYRHQWLRRSEVLDRRRQGRGSCAFAGRDLPTLRPGNRLATQPGLEAHLRLPDSMSLARARANNRCSGVERFDWWHVLNSRIAFLRNLPTMLRQPLGICLHNGRRSPVRQTDRHRCDCNISYRSIQGKFESGSRGNLRALTGERSFLPALCGGEI